MSSVNYKGQLNDYCMANRLHIEYSSSSSGIAHIPEWKTVAHVTNSGATLYIEEGVGTNKISSQHDAARKVLSRVASFAPSSFSSPPQKENAHPANNVHSNGGGADNNLSPIDELIGIIGDKYRVFLHFTYIRGDWKGTIDVYKCEGGKKWHAIFEHRGPSRAQVEEIIANKALEKMLRVLSGEDNQEEKEEEEEEEEGVPKKESLEDSRLTLNSKGLINELCQRFNGPPPRYVTTYAGPDHAPNFIAKISILTPNGEFSEQGTGKTKKEAEHSAARNLWIKLINMDI